MSEARTRLARVGIDDLRGYLEGGIEAWTKAGFALAELPLVDVHKLGARLQAAQFRVLDVRRRPEWEAGHIEGAVWHPLDDFKAGLPELDRGAPIAVHCKGGYRSLIACSLLQRAGFQNVANVSGGFVAWEKAGLPVVAESPVGV